METLYIDTNILLNVILEEELFVETSFRLLKDIEAGKYSAVTSLLTLMEIHRILQKEGKVEKDITDVVQKIPQIGISLVVPDRDDIIRSYEFIKNLWIDPMDSIHLSVAIEMSTIFITRDIELTKKIRSVLKVMTPDDLIPERE